MPAEDVVIKGSFTAMPKPSLTLTKTALDAKKAAGVKLGRPFGAESKKLKLSKNTKRIRDLLDKKVPKAQIARIMGVQKITLRRFIKRMGWSD